MEKVALVTGSSSGIGLETHASTCKKWLSCICKYERY